MKRVPRGADKVPVQWSFVGEGVVHTVQDRRWLGWKKGDTQWLGRACKGSEGR